MSNLLTYDDLMVGMTVTVESLAYLGPQTVVELPPVEVYDDGARFATVGLVDRHGNEWGLWHDADDPIFLPADVPLTGDRC
jgi:hypothetical protein